MILSTIPFRLEVIVRNAVGLSRTPHLDKLCKKYPGLRLGRAFARAGHDSIGQVRKYSGRPYWAHTEAVAELIAKHNGSLLLVLAALFHDLIEDVFPKNPYYSLARIRSNWGSDVSSLVAELSDRYTKENYPELNRAKRKALEAAREISPEAATVKLADVYDNGVDIEKHDPGFAVTYKRELLLKLAHLRHVHVTGNYVLFHMAEAVLNFQPESEPT